MLAGGATAMADWILAVDFGTTTTSAAMGVGAEAEVVEVDGAARMPSVVLATSSGDLVVGAAAEAQMGLAPERAERTPKRRLGDEVMLLGDRPVRPVEAVAAILRVISAEAIRRQGGVAPSELRLTHPARWGSLRREKLAEAAALADLPAPVFVPEPVAAAVHFVDERIEDGSFVAVYDLGGGTFDTAVLRRNGDGFDVVGLPGGDEHLGGEVFDERLLNHVGSRIALDDPDAWENLRFSSERSWRKVGHDLRLEVRRAKEALSANTEYTVYVGSPVDTTVLVTRDELEALIRADVTATVDELEATVARAGIEVADLAAVNLTGGSSRIPLVTRLVAERLGQLPQTWGDPKAAVALGAVKATRLTTVTSAGGSSSVAVVAPLPERVGDYEVVAELGRGGMGVVYLARQASVGRLVAVKTLPVVDPNLTDRLRREAAVLAELQHPNVATVIDVGTDERGTHVVMPFFQGGTVAHVLDRSGPLSPGAAASVLASVATALAACHDKGFLHRDVKPSNVLLSDGGDPYLADFGLALPMLDSSRLTNSRSVLGTAPYTAPEILADETPTAAADTYALGVMGYQLLTGSLPYAGTNVLAVLDAVRRGEPTPIDDRAAGIPPALAALVMGAFEADPAARPTDLRAWAAAVRAAVEPEALRPAPPAAWAAAAAGAPVLPISASGDDLDSDQPTSSDGPRTSDLAAGAALGVAAGSGAAAAVVPDDVAELIGFQPAGDAGEPAALADVPSAEGRFARSGAKVLGGAAAAILLLVAAVAIVSRGGDDPAKVEAFDDTVDTTDTTEGTDDPAVEKVKVPVLVSLSLAEATAKLTALDLKVKQFAEYAGHPPGTVLRVSHKAGTRLAPGSTVVLAVSKGPKPAPDSGGTTGGTDGGSTGGTDGGTGGTDGGTTGGTDGGTDGGTTGTDGGTDGGTPNRPPTPSHGSGNPDEYDLCGVAGVCQDTVYYIWMTTSAFSDPDGDTWAYQAAYDADATYGYVDLWTGTDGGGASCASRVGGACLRYRPTPGSVNAACYSDWVTFTARDSKGAVSAKYWLRIWVNC